MQKETVCEIGANISDMSGEEIGFLMDMAVDAGALNVWAQPILMQKRQPAFLVTVICRKHDATRFCELLLKHSMAFDLRIETKSMIFMDADMMYLQTSFGMVRVKRAGNKKYVEYEDLVRIARKENISISDARERILEEIGI
ncbi:MAG: nickel insertion protein [Christensenellaceae bacterium]|jgi:uncharacterized protein (DUF111 family)